MQFLVPGKKNAEALLVANQLTIDALPAGCRGKIHMMPEVSVDLTLWKDEAKPARDDRKIKVIYLGRLVNWKAVDLLIEAFGQVTKQVDNAYLQILGTAAIARSWKNRCRIWASPTGWNLPAM